MKIASVILTIGYCKLNWNFKLKCTQTDSYVYWAPFIKMKINLIFPPRRRAIANLSRLHGHALTRKDPPVVRCFVMHISQGVDLRHELLWCFSLTPGPPKLLKVIFCINLKSWVFNAISPKTQGIRYSTRTVLEPLQKWSLDEYFTAKSWKKSLLRRIDWEWVTLFEHDFEHR